MSSVVRLVLLWMLALAVPVQGTWAAMMPTCGLHLPPHGQAADPRPAAHMHHHMRRAESSLPAKLSDGHVPAHKCSVCVAGCLSCCLACSIHAAAATPPLSFAAVQALDVHAPFVVGVHAAFVGDRLERPPRFILA